MARDRPPRYHAYLLRFWEVRSERPDCPAAWRFSLVDAETRQKYGFPDLEALSAFLEEKTGGFAQRKEQPGNTGERGV